MILVLKILVALIALIHFYFLYLEMFLWTKPAGMKIFGRTPEQARDSAVLAANQGLYNGFLAAGLFWGLAHPNPEFGFQIQVFFLGCVLVAGIYGGLTANKKILKIQAAPALIALILAFFVH